MGASPHDAPGRSAAARRSAQGTIHAVAIAPDGSAGTTTAASRPRTPHWFRSRRAYWRKNHGTPALWAANLLWMAGFAFGKTKALVARRRYVQPPRLYLDFIRYTLLSG